MIRGRRGHVHSLDGPDAKPGHPGHAGAVNGATVAPESYDIPRLEERGRLFNTGGQIREPVKEGTLRFTSPAKVTKFGCFSGNGGIVFWEKLGGG